MFNGNKETAEWIHFTIEEVDVVFLLNSYPVGLLQCN